MNFKQLLIIIFQKSREEEQKGRKKSGIRKGIVKKQQTIIKKFLNEDGLEI